MKFTQLDTLYNDKPMNSFLEERRIAHLRKSLVEHDNAFLNSFLSHAVYTGRQWTLELIKNHPAQLSGDYDVQKKFRSVIESAEENMTDKKAYEIYISTYLRNTFELVDLPVQTGKYKSKNFGYETNINFKNGDYEALDNLARAGIFRSKNKNGSYTLHVAFRGTDTGARPFSDYVTGAYADIESYADCFKPLEKALIEYVTDINNNITDVHLSGHSLGGAPVQIMLDSLNKNSQFKKLDVKLKGYTYGSVGGFSYLWNKVVSCAYHAVAHQNFQQFKKLGVSALQALNLQKTASDSEIYRYKHSGDLIPIVGILGYNNKGVTFDLNDACGSNLQAEKSVGGNKIYCTKEDIFTNLSLLQKTKVVLIDMPLNTLKKMFTLGYHDMLRYVRNVDSHINNLMIGNPELQEEGVTRRFDEFQIYTKKYNKITNTLNNQISRKMFCKSDAPIIQIPLEKSEAMVDLKKVVSKMKNIRMATAISKDLDEQLGFSSPKMV